MIVQPQQIATHSLRSSSRGGDICRVLATAINSSDAAEAIFRHVSCDSGRLSIDDYIYNLNLYKRVIVIGAGKAVIPMANAMDDILKDHLTSGFIITKDGYLDPHRPTSEKIEIIEAGHPLPDQRNLVAGTNLFSSIENLRSDDLILCLLSGGASALLMAPAPGISLQDLQAATALLLNCGATIMEINTIRKHLDIFKGGGLAKLLTPSTVISLILSDVIGDSIDMIASGPTTADPTTFTDAWSILEKYQILDRVPHLIKAHILAGKNGKVQESLKAGDPILERATNVIIGNNSYAVHAAANEANNLGFITRILTTSLHGEASQVGRKLSEDAIALLSPPSSLTRPVCLIASGETTVTIKGTGLGGRNQELSLGAVNSLSGSNQIILASLATDGGDGPTDAAGAVTTNETYSRGLSFDLDPQAYLHRNDSYSYFEQLGDLIKTGPTLTNVNDLVFIFGL